MEPTNTELSSRTGAIFSWLEFLGIVLMLFSAITFRNYRDVLQLIALIFLLSGSIYKIVLDWKQGRKRSARFRMVILGIIVIAVTIVALR